MSRHAREPPGPRRGGRAVRRGFRERRSAFHGGLRRRVAGAATGAVRSWTARAYRAGASGLHRRRAWTRRRAGRATGIAVAAGGHGVGLDTRTVPATDLRES